MLKLRKPAMHKLLICSSYKYEYMERGVAVGIITRIIRQNL